MMTRIVIFMGLFLSLSATLAGQAERKYIRQGNREYKEEKFDESEILYRRALESDEESYAGEFNLGDALYKQEQYEDAARNFKELAEKVDDPLQLSHLYHNLGNSLLQANQLEASIDAYKNALRKNPLDEETRHNLAFAQSMLQQQQQQQQQDQQNQDQDQQDQQQDQQNQDQDQQDQKDQQQDQQNQDEQEQDQQNQDQQQQQQQQQISREDAERMLQALQEDEQKLQEKLKKQQARARRVRVLKDW